MFKEACFDFGCFRDAYGMEVHGDGCPEAPEGDQLTYVQTIASDEDPLSEHDALVQRRKDELVLSEPQTRRRKSKCTPEVTKLAVEVLRSGGTFTDIAEVVGVTTNAIHNWIRKGRDGNPKYQEFAVEVGSAIFEVRSFLLDNWRGFAVRDWKAAKALLERYDKLGSKDIEMKMKQLKLRKLAADAKVAELQAEAAARELSGTSFSAVLKDVARIQDMQRNHPDQLEPKLQKGGGLPWRRQEPDFEGENETILISAAGVKKDG